MPLCALQTAMHSNRCSSSSIAMEDHLLHCNLSHIPLSFNDLQSQSKH